MDVKVHVTKWEVEWSQGDKMHCFLGEWKDRTG